MRLPKKAVLNHIPINSTSLRAGTFSPRATDGSWRGKSRPPAQILRQEAAEQRPRVLRRASLSASCTEAVASSSQTMGSSRQIEAAIGKDGDASHDITAPGAKR
jgi:hypothetical protein